MITAQRVLPEDLGQLVSVGFIICKSTVIFQLLASSGQIWQLHMKKQITSLSNRSWVVPRKMQKAKSLLLRVTLTSLYCCYGICIQQATSFISACHGQTHCSTMSETRLKVWLSKPGKGSSTPKLYTLPPTTEAFKENVKRAHHQALVWQSLEAQNPPELNSTEYGWVKDDQNKSLQPVTLPDEVELVPEMVLRLIKCGYHSTTPCSSRACSCNSANMKCTRFCACYNQGCCNPTS